MRFRIASRIVSIETIAVGKSIRDIARLNRHYGRGRWRKLKGRAVVEFEDGDWCLAEIHWYEAHGAGPKEHKIGKIIKELT